MSTIYMGCSPLFRLDAWALTTSGSMISQSNSPTSLFFSGKELDSVALAQNLVKKTLAPIQFSLLGQKTRGLVCGASEFESQVTHAGSELGSVSLWRGISHYAGLSMSPNMASCPVGNYH